MSRSLHTIPRRVRALHRAKAPYERRAAGARSLRPAGCYENSLTCGGKPAAVPIRVVNVALWEAEGTGTARQPVIRIQRPRPGFFHPLSKSDVRSLLRSLGAQFYYGIRSIEMVSGAGRFFDRTHRFGSLASHGRILLFDQPVSPWRLSGQLPDAVITRMIESGAVVEWRPEQRQTTVAWPEGSLREFMLLEVLLHEIGHHVAQQSRRKPNTRTLRTCDHESWASLFAHRWRIQRCA